MGIRLVTLRSIGAVCWEGAVRLREAGREIGRGYRERQATAKRSGVRRALLPV